jgi:hypothetical protein
MRWQEQEVLVIDADDCDEEKSDGELLATRCRALIAQQCGTRLRACLWD